MCFNPKTYTRRCSCCKKILVLVLLPKLLLLCYNVYMYVVIMYIMLLQQHVFLSIYFTIKHKTKNIKIKKNKKKKQLVYKREISLRWALKKTRKMKIRSVRRNDWLVDNHSLASNPGGYKIMKSRGRKIEIVVKWH